MKKKKKKKGKKEKACILHSFMSEKDMKRQKGKSQTETSVAFTTNPIFYWLFLCSFLSLLSLSLYIFFWFNYGLFTESCSVSVSSE